MCLLWGRLKVNSWRICFFLCINNFLHAKHDVVHFMLQLFMVQRIRDYKSSFNVFVLGMKLLGPKNLTLLYGKQLASLLSSRDDAEWYLAESLTTGQQGYIPYNFIAMTTVETESTCFNTCSLLIFIAATGSYSLSVRDLDHNTGEGVKHYRIRNMDNGGFYITTKISFNSLKELVQHYSRIYAS
ncbi:hypothetical protein XENOCAPTIV_010914 [Xenoophorus captivus]|uniref:SH2 domain-containing protein n=1 Tax=Xenoophorus captivus TaxID=1517983 RepID=A0ABV0QU35_9TELE